jgi:hypothetical protein
MISFTRRGAVRLLAGGAVVALLPGARGLAGPAAGAASGTLTVNGMTTPVAYAYARAAPGFFDASSTDTLVIVSDVPLDAAALGDAAARNALADAGKLHAFEITIDAAGMPVSTAWRHNGFRGPSPSGVSSADLFALRRGFVGEGTRVRGGAVVEGRYKSAAPAEFFGNVSLFDVAFRAVVAR